MSIVNDVRDLPEVDTRRTVPLSWVQRRGSARRRSLREEASPEVTPRSFSVVALAPADTNRRGSADEASEEADLCHYHNNYGHSKRTTYLKTIKYND